MKRSVALAKPVPMSPEEPFRLGGLAGEVEVSGDVRRPLNTQNQWAAWRRGKLERLRGARALRRDGA